ncbi:BMP family ABC transporter substrate-binding protein [Microbacterium sp. NEAU-LLC]|uniref:BMP family ABC transporter substrate-binding protein n=1 Tax=Microbacterium helvum TaxID=2773713 RepID=A0ABR8NTR0_9MICO|nr:BMP family ABC transporter substrate-binding protein [Microbacterium helvum]MBD3943438.1 BMP family ABC transporter substrate-binding protein [Microbacterium helvum]
MLLRALSATAAVAALVLSLTGCATDDWSTPRAQPTIVGTPAAGFLPATAPSPEATVTPEDGSWNGVSPSAGYRVVLLTSGSDATTGVLNTAVAEWASDEGASLRTVAAEESDPIPAIVDAMDMNPDLIVSTGEALVDALALVSPNHLDVSFLVLGAELAEPTYNVTSVDWTGAGFRGEGLGSATHFDEDSFTPARADAAIRAGSAAVLTGMTGVVLWID